MPVQELEQFLPVSNNPLEAFNVVGKKHAGVVGLNAQELRAFPVIDMVANTAVRFFSAALGYLANRSTDPILQRLGAAAWYATYHQETIQLRLATDMIEVAVENGVPREGVKTIFMGHDQPHQFYMANVHEGQILSRRGLILFPPEFLIRCQETPVTGLSESASIAAFIVQTYTGMADLNPEGWMRRGQVVQARLLHEIQTLHPQVALEDDQLELLNRYSEILNLPL